MLAIMMSLYIIVDLIVSRRIGPQLAKTYVLIMTTMMIFIFAKVNVVNIGGD